MHVIIFFNTVLHLFFSALNLQRIGSSLLPVSNSSNGNFEAGKVIHIEPDLRPSDQTSLLFAVYIGGKTSIGKIWTAGQDPPKRLTFLESAPSLLWSFTQINQTHSLIVDRNQHCFRLFSRIGWRFSVFAGTCGVVQTCLTCEGYRYPYDVIYHTASQTFYHTNRFRREVASLDLIERKKQIIAQIPFRVQFALFTSILTFHGNQNRIIMNLRQANTTLVQLREIDLSPNTNFTTRQIYSYEFGFGEEILFFNESTLLQSSVTSQKNIIIRFRINEHGGLDSSNISEPQSQIASNDSFQCGTILSANQSLVLVEGLTFNFYSTKEQKARNGSYILTSQLWLALLHAFCIAIREVM